MRNFRMLTKNVNPRENFPRVGLGWTKERESTDLTLPSDGKVSEIPIYYPITNWRAILNRSLQTKRIDLTSSSGDDVEKYC